MLKIRTVLCIFLFMGGAEVLGQGREASTQIPPQLIINHVEVNDTSIVIHGANFGTNPLVLLPGGSLSPLTLQPPSTSELIVAFLPQNLKPGSYILIVSRGRATTDTAAIDVTIGSAGPAGPEGKPGRDGKDGKDGLPGKDGLNGLACWDLNGNRISDSTEDRNADGLFNAMDCQGPAGAVATTGSISAQGWSAKRTGLVSFSGGTTTWTTVPGLSLTFALQRSGLVQVLANGTQRTTNGTTHVAYRFVVDGVPAGDPSHGQLIQTANANEDASAPWTLAHFVPLDAGTHTIEVQVRNSLVVGVSPTGYVCGVQSYSDCTLNVLAVYP
jgi:hypothetical protein